MFPYRSTMVDRGRIPTGDSLAPSRTGVKGLEAVGLQTDAEHVPERPQKWLA